jgi:uncharacterized membrane protein YhaH (DUF805 family)
MFSFEGRIGRRKWWALIILANVVFLVAYIIAAAIPVLLLVVVPVAIVCSCAINTRRLHDVGWSGWWNLASLVPFLGGLFLLGVCGIAPGNPRSNKYGYPDGYVSHYVGSSALKAHDAAPNYLQAQTDIHPSLQEANERAWASTRHEYRP